MREREGGREGGREQYDCTHCGQKYEVRFGDEGTRTRPSSSAPSSQDRHARAGGRVSAQVATTHERA